MPHREASSQAAWALVTEGVTSARIEAHRLRHLLSRAMKLIDQSEHKEQLFQVAGDILTGAPTRLDMLENSLDKTALALSKMGEVFLEARLSISDKTEVEEAVEPSFGGSRNRHSAVDRVAARWTTRCVERT